MKQFGVPGCFFPCSSLPPLSNVAGTGLGREEGGSTCSPLPESPSGRSCLCPQERALRSPRRHPSAVSLSGSTPGCWALLGSTGCHLLPAPQPLPRLPCLAPRTPRLPRACLFSITSGAPTAQPELAAGATALKKARVGHPAPGEHPRPSTRLATPGIHPIP